MNIEAINRPGPTQVRRQMHRRVDSWFSGVAFSLAVGLIVAAVSPSASGLSPAMLYLSLLISYGATLGFVADSAIIGWGLLCTPVLIVVALGVLSQSPPLFVFIVLCGIYSPYGLYRLVALFVGRDRAADITILLFAVGLFVLILINPLWSALLIIITCGWLIGTPVLLGMGAGFFFAALYPCVDTFGPPRIFFPRQFSLKALFVFMTWSAVFFAIMGGLHPDALQLLWGTIASASGCGAALVVVYVAAKLSPKMPPFAPSPAS